VQDVTAALDTDRAKAERSTAPAGVAVGTSTVVQPCAVVVIFLALNNLGEFVLE
jgi:hypothetical protein